MAWQHAIDYIALLNAEQYLGYDDWRLPSIKELITLMDYSLNRPPLDPLFGSGTWSYYWTSTTYAYNSSEAWRGDFYDGQAMILAKDKNIFVRPVRGELYGAMDNFVINGDGTITDTTTNMIWQQCDYGESWNDLGAQVPQQIVLGSRLCNVYSGP